MLVEPGPLALEPAQTLTVQALVQQGLMQADPEPMARELPQPARALTAQVRQELMQAESEPVVRAQP